MTLAGTDLRIPKIVCDNFLPLTHSRKCKDLQILSNSLGRELFDLQIKNSKKTILGTTWS